MLDDWCEKEKRDPSEIARTVKLSFHLVVDAKAAERVEGELRKA